MKKNYEASLDAKTNAISELSFANIEKISNETINTTFIKLSKLFESSAMTEDGILDILNIISVVKSLILSDLMRDECLNDLDQEQAESLALELYLTLEKERCGGWGYVQLCDASNHIIERHLSEIYDDSTARHMHHG